MPLGVTRVLLDGVGVGVLSGKLTKQNETWSLILQSDGLSFCKPLACKAGASTHNGEVSCLSDVFQKKIFQGLRARRAYIAFLADFHFLQDQANFWQTDLYGGLCVP